MSSEESAQIALIKNHVKSYLDFPKSGIIFQDVFSILQEPKVFLLLKEVLCEHIKAISPAIEYVAALDARGFLFGPIIALEFGIPFIPIRKKGKLPGNVKSESYQLEYGEDTLQIPDGCIKQGGKVLLVDDLLATGGSLSAGIKLVEAVGGEVVECLVIMELVELKGRSKLNVPVHPILTF